MSEERPVTSCSHAKSETKKNWQMPTAIRIIGLRNFIWVFVLAGIAGFLYLRGTPHILFEYSYFGSKDHKTDCTYTGLHPQTVGASGGKCPIIRFLKAPE